MYYINKKPDEISNYGCPMGNPFPECINLPDELLDDYIASRGFVSPILDEDGITVTAVPVNQEALDAYLKEYPDVEPEEPVDEETVTWSAMAKAIREGVNEV